MITTIKRCCMIFAAALAATLLAAPAASAFVISPGRDPGIAVDAAGTAYIAWNGLENASTLHFCRLPRAATVCDGAAASQIVVPALSTATNRPWVAVSGNRVTIVQNRYPLGGTFQAGTYLYTSGDRGATFPGAGLKVGNTAFYEAIVGPNDALSGISTNGTFFQSVPLNGTPGPGAVRAELSTTHQYGGTVGLIDPATPLAVYTSGSGAGQFRRYDGSGPINDVLNWTTPIDLTGVFQTPRLAGGPSGLVLVSGNGSGSVYARKWNGSGFGAPVTIGAGASPQALFQDAGGRTHLVYQGSASNGRTLIHAVSDDGTTWRKGTVSTETNFGFQFAEMRVATAPDHVGVVVWMGGVNEIRVAGVGPGAPATTPPPPPPPPPAVKPKPTFTASGRAKRTGRRFRISVKGRLVLPAGVAKTAGCTGHVKVTIKRAHKTLVTKTVAVRKSCAFTFSATVARSKVKRSTKLAIRLGFLGNNALAAATKVGSIKVKR